VGHNQTPHLDEKHLMRRQLLRTCCVLGLLALSLQSLATRAGDLIHFNTDTGVMTINGNQAFNYFGVTMQTSVVSGVQQFRFLGDLNFIDGDVVTASGSRPLSLWAGNNVNVAPGAIFNFDASGQTGKLGGGNGGSAISGGASAGVGGIGGFGFFVLGGAGGAGGDIGGANIVNPGSAGGTGATANFGTPGTAGSAGQAGAVGQAGFQNISIAAAGTSGTAGSLGATILSQEEGGFGGAGGVPQVLGVDGEPGNDATVPGSNGRNGGAGGNGGNGGAGQNNVSGFILSGGAGGASGGSGGGGGGGGGGSTGRGGGGGGGGSSGTVPITIIFEGGADGGPGGFGGNGGNGGSGSQGVASGRGGAGAGAIEIAAQGSISFAGTMNIRGAAGVAGTTSSSAESGTVGGAGTPGFAGETTPLGVGGHGGPGGAGSAGGNGGNGGRGGNGGHGGGGAGGTIMFKSSLFSAAGGTINAGGGALAGSPGTTFGGNGRYVVSDNGAFQPDYGDVSDASEEFLIGQAARDINPLIQGSVSTPNITQLQGGADVYGLINVNFDGVPEFLDLQENAPVGATGALIRRNAGFLGDQYFGHDMLMLVNLTDSPIASPVLGICPTGEGFQSSLPERGFARNPAFGGSGPVTLTSLPAESVYATLVPKNLTDYEVFGYAGYGKTVSWDTLDVAYLGPPIYMLGDFDLDGDVDGRDFLMWQRGESPIQWGPGDLADWQTNYGFSSLTVASTAVPEPGSLVLLGTLLVVITAPLRCAMSRG
jgi:hypothetical protein